MSANGTRGSSAGVVGGGCGGPSSAGVFWTTSVAGVTIGSGVRLSVESAGIAEVDGVEVRASGAESARGRGSAMPCDSMCSSWNLKSKSPLGPCSL